MGWIRIDDDMADHPKVIILARLCGVSVEEVFGHVVRLLGKVGRFAKDGNVAPLTAAELELWANWRKEPGLFDRHFRAQFTNDDVITGWAQRNGKLLDRQQKDRERHRTQSSAETPRKSTQSSAEKSALRNENDTSTTTTHHFTARERFIASCPASKRQTWIRTIAGWQEGMGTAGCARATEADIEQGLTEYDLNRKSGETPTARHVASYIDKSIEVRKRPVSAYSGGRGVKVAAGQQGYNNAEIALDALGVPHREV